MSKVSRRICPYNHVERIRELELKLEACNTLRRGAEARVKELEADAASWRRMKQHIRELRGEDSG